ncbi:MAG: biopolymer transporter ExbD [Candidatus Symbiothrix sp.]|jgi:biopolymer transport protein ExbD|nr:biopolymer transporter ExbD [Candidatus Symbiothrix sp.]
MAKAKVKKQSTFIDMTAMSDVTVLLLTFFMLTSTFVQKEPIDVTTPASVSEIKIPETNLLTILVDSKGKIFLSLDNDNDKRATLEAVGADYGITFTPKQLNTFKALEAFGVPIRSMAGFLDLPSDQQDAYMKNLDSQRVGIPAGDVELKDAKGLVASDNEFKRWVAHANEVNDELQIAIKADKTTEYPVVRTVMDDLRKMKKNRYLLITSLKTASSE